MDDLPEALRDLAPVTHDMQHTFKAEILFEAADRIEALEAENEKLMQWNADMVAKAAAGGVLDGYREMGARIAALEAENAVLREALGGTSETGRGYTLKKIREDLESCGFSGKDAELVITYLLSSGLIQIGKDMMARAALARQTEGEG